ncbi:MAG: hypothetical protein RMJ33_14085 [Saprospiraceae bacterium]|nr:hypothetical protein [Saprospiraceae bacterium]MDW8230959.1 hypothetical protein [Saprospiraceae bacterium]
MNDLLKNPVAVFIAGLLFLWLALKVLRIVVSEFWIVVLAFVLLFVLNERFRQAVQAFFLRLFR